MLVAASGLSVTFGASKVIRSVSFGIEHGEMTALIGSNGSGKSTLFNCLTGFVRPSSGSIHFSGADITRWPVWRRARAGIRRTFQGAHVVTRYTVQENMVMAGWRNGDLGDMLDRLSLAHALDHPAESLSFGQRRLLTLAMAAALPPKLLLLDEPTAGVAPGLLPELATFIRSLNASTIIIDHNMEFLESLNCRTLILSGGQVREAGAISDVLRNRELREIYA